MTTTTATEAIGRMETHRLTMLSVCWREIRDEAERFDVPPGALFLALLRNWKAAGRPTLKISFASENQK